MRATEAARVVCRWLEIWGPGAWLCSGCERPGRACVSTVCAEGHGFTGTRAGLSERDQLSPVEA